MKTLLYVFLVLLMASVCFSQDVTLSWDPNSESDLLGYKIYYGYDSGVYNCDGSPIEIVIDPAYLNDENYYMQNDNPEFQITNLNNSDYYFVVTAFDDEEPRNESGYSNEVNTIDNPVTPPPSGGGSSGGCFINSIK